MDDLKLINMEQPWFFKVQIYSHRAMSQLMTKAVSVTQLFLKPRLKLRTKQSVLETKNLTHEVALHRTDRKLLGFADLNASLDFEVRNR